MKILSNTWSSHNLRRTYFPLNGRQVTWITTCTVQQHWWRCTSPCRLPEELKDGILARQRPLALLQHHPITSNHHNSPSSCCCSLLVRINVLEHLDANFSQPRPLSQILNRHGPQVQLPQRLHGRFASRFQKYGQALRSASGSSAKSEVSSASHVRICEAG
jgi:hypothetical protein